MGTLPDWDAGLVTLMARPNFYLEMTSDHAWITHMKPKTTTLTEMEVTWLVRKDAVEGVDYDVDRLTDLWKTTAEQDWTICENNQAGIESSRYEPGPLAPSESQIEVFESGTSTSCGRQGGEVAEMEDAPSDPGERLPGMVTASTAREVDSQCFSAISRANSVRKSKARVLFGCWANRVPTSL